MSYRPRWRTGALLLLAALASGCGAELGAPIEVQPFRIVAADGAPAWSPDGTRIAYFHSVGSVNGISLVDTAGVVTQQILGGDWGYPDWSPDGTRLAISKGNVIYTVQPTGADPQAIATGGYRPRWSPSGSELAFQSFDTTGTGRIAIVSRDGTRLRLLTPSGIESWREPDWSPDGTRLLHVRYFPYWPDSSSRDDIFVVDSTGHSEQRLTQDLSVNATPTWSPDGQWIAWSKGGTIWIMKPDGTEAHALIYGDEPAWSPDSRRIAFSQVTGNVVRLYAIDPATLRVRQLTR